MCAFPELLAAFGIVMDCNVYTNVTDHVKIGLILDEPSPVPKNPVKSAMWALSVVGCCKDFLCEDFPSRRLDEIPSGAIAVDSAGALDAPHEERERYDRHQHAPPANAYALAAPRAEEEVDGHKEALRIDVGDVAAGSPNSTHRLPPLMHQHAPGSSAESTTRGRRMLFPFGGHRRGLFGGHRHRPHGHSPHGHSPHGHSPHGHAPHSHAPHSHDPHDHIPPRLITAFEPVGYAEQLTKGDVGRNYPILNVIGTGLKLENGQGHYFNLYLCDAFDNCHMTCPNKESPLTIDETPPVMPMRALADVNHRSSSDGITQYWISKTRIDPLFMFEDYDLTSRTSEQPKAGLVDHEIDLVDPESGNLAGAHIDLFRLRPGDPAGREHNGRYVMSSCSLPAGFICIGEFPVPNLLHANVKMHGLNLQIGGRYMMEFVQTNKAGGITVWPSEQITADWTHPVCTTPWLSAGPGGLMVQAMTQPVGSTGYGGTRAHSWVTAETRTINVHLADATCLDPESGISGTTMWVATKRDGVGDIYPEEPFELGTVKTITVTPLLELKDQLECDQCGDDTVIGVRCTNGAAQWKICQRYASFRVDGSPPKCKNGFVLAGEGSRRGYQSVYHTLKVKPNSNPNPDHNHNHDDDHNHNANRNPTPNPPQKT